MYIAVDFDGTCVTHEYPKVGRDVGAVPVLKKLVAAGHLLILFTMRHDEGLDDAIQWFKDNGIPLFGINHNPTQVEWTNSPKAYAHIYIDDAAAGTPLVHGLPPFERDYVDWEAMEQILIDKGYLPPEDEVA